jgi:predicted amidohydrolase
MSALTVSVIQTNLHWEHKEKNLSMLEEKIRSIDQKTEIVMLPEMFSTGFSMNPQSLAEKMDGPTLSWMNKIAVEKRIILTGSIIIEDNGHFYNRLIWMLPNGQYGYYDKRHLFAYAGEDEKYHSGGKRLIASVKGWKINLLICYDLRFPVWARQSPSADEAGVFEYDLLVYVANWPEKRIHAWKTLLQARAIENQCFVIGVNRTGKDGNDIIYSGDSMIVDPLGEICWQKTGEEAITTYTLQKEKLDEVRSRFPFWRDADLFTILP